jgi:hypothetical protein
MSLVQCSCFPELYPTMPVKEVKKCQVKSEVQERLPGSNPNLELEPMKGIYQVAVHPDKIIGYYEPLRAPVRKVYKDENGDPVKPISSKFDITTVDNSHNGMISKNASRKIERALSYLTFVSKVKEIPQPFGRENSRFFLSFTTVTLPSKQIHSDQEIMRECFQPFLNSMRQKFGVVNYIWKAEKQGNGNIHYHILADKFIPWMDIRNTWNKHVNKLGYVDRYRENRLRERDFEKSGVRELIKTSYSSKDFRNPNSTDIHGLRFVKNLLAYFIKYMTKSEGNIEAKPGYDAQSTEISGRLWGCSESLSKLKGCVVCESEEVKNILSEAIDKYELDVFVGDYFYVIKCPAIYLKDVAGGKLYIEFMKYVFSHFYS